MPTVSVRSLAVSAPSVTIAVRLPTVSVRSLAKQRKHRQTEKTIGQKVLPAVHVKRYCIPHPVEFENTLDLNTDGTLIAKANIKIDRTKYGIKFRSNSFFDNLREKTISYTFEFNVTLTGT